MYMKNNYSAIPKWIKSQPNPADYLESLLKMPLPEDFRETIIYHSNGLLCMIQDRENFIKISSLLFDITKNNKIESTEALKSLIATVRSSPLISNLQNFTDLDWG